MRKTISALFTAALVVLATSQALAETDAQWKPSVFNKISKCRSLWIGLRDVPADTNATTRDTTFVCHTRYVLSHDNVSKTPDWVIEHWKSADLKKNFTRPKNKGFNVEMRVPPNGRANEDDYTKPKAQLTRGHMAPSDDFSKNKSWLNESFIFSNVVPQIGAKFNSAIWGTLEDEVRAAGKARGEIYVITGPVRGSLDSRERTLPKTDNACGNEIQLKGPREAFICREDNRKPNVFCTKGVAVPIGIYKIVYDPKKAEAFAFLMPNIDHPTGMKPDESRAYLQKFRVTLTTIEGATGLRFFQDFPAAEHDKIVKQCAAGTLW